LHDGEYCIFHSKDIEGKKEKFNDAFWIEFERQKEHGEEDDFSGEEIYDFSGFVFPGEILFERKTFEKDVNFMDAEFYGNASFRAAVFTGNASFWGTKFNFGATFSFAQFSKNKNANFFGAHFYKKSSFIGAIFSGDTNFAIAFFKEVNFEETKFLGKVCFESATLCSSEFSKVNLQGANLNGAHLIGANLQGANLRGAELQEANLKGANLHKTDIRGAELEGTNFEDANVLNIKYNRHARYRGIKLSNCSGSPLFVRFAKDQEYIEDFKSSKLRKPLFLLWLIFADCGRSFWVVAVWSVFFALLFAGVFFFCLGSDAFEIKHLEFSFCTMLYYSVVTLTTLGFGDVTPKTEEASILVMAEVIIGYIMLGLLISILANKLARRS
jgi:uncharacterized protein YjbI with pentapeptide repeats